jgi:hypothetical protein
MENKRGPGRPRKNPPTLKEILKTAYELIDKKIELAIIELVDKRIEQAVAEWWPNAREACEQAADKSAANAATEEMRRILGDQKIDFVTLLNAHIKKWHPMCDPKELDHVLRLLREEFERRKHGQS